MKKKNNPENNSPDNCTSIQNKKLSPAEIQLKILKAFIKKQKNNQRINKKWRRK